MSSILVIATQADLDPIAIRSMLDELAAEGVIERHTDSTDTMRVALT